ncbi:Integrase core domain protein [compost metagenome]
MPWKRESPMDQRICLIDDWLTGRFSKSELSRQYGISRPTLDKWLRRFTEHGKAGLQELSRRPLSSPSRTDDAILERLVAEKQQRFDWGPKKLITRLRQVEPEIRWPAPSTAGEWLERFGLVTPRRLRKRHVYAPPILREGLQPNQVWCTDFKGHFRTQDGRWCYPLTLSDHATRYLLACRGLERPTGAQTRPWFEWAFREYGLPEAIRSDNGSPFASSGLARLSSLAVWWIRLGIYPERIRPGRPDQNGRHERMHRTLKAATLKPAAADLLHQQIAFERFREDYNTQRPHEALGMQVPAACYTPSLRPYPTHLPDIDYPADMKTRRVRGNGEIKWQGCLIFLSEALIGEWVALREVDTDTWELYFSDYKLGRLEPGTTQVRVI